MFQIDKDSLLPIYHQIEEGIKELIAKEDLKPGEVIPSEREWSERYNVSRMTVRQAINNLVNDGYLVRQRGKGTFVANSKIEQGLQGLTSFSEDMQARGMVPSSKLLEFNLVKASVTIASKLKINEGEIVYEIKRVRLADDIPMAYEMLYISETLVPNLTEEVLSSSMYDYMENTLGIRIAKGEQVLEASIARKNEAAILQIQEGASVLLIERTSFLENEKPVEFVQSVYRGDRYKFKIEMERH
ncbi:GntR family transcriptional regulator [Ectobacillus polymachus]|uniref:GntR family transcriptional regulator n=1 Tax=Ectobacillus polymachus TaxID=1508806 RepID=UPI003A84DFC5